MRHTPWWCGLLFNALLPVDAACQLACPCASTHNVSCHAIHPLQLRTTEPMAVPSTLRSCRRVMLPGGRDVVLSDTVGFISDLPHALVEAFRVRIGGSNPMRSPPSSVNQNRFTSRVGEQVLHGGSQAGLTCCCRHSRGLFENQVRSPIKRRPRSRR